MKLLYVRHGKSMANASAMVGVPDTPLAQEGMEQARVTGQDLQSQNVTTIVCSSFLRAQQTAEIIAGEVGVPLSNIIIVDELHERRMGTLEGKPKQHETPFFYENDSEFGFETHAELIARLQVAVAKVKEIASQAAGTTVIVGHATSGFFFLQVTKGKKTFADMDPHFQMSNAEFIEVQLAD